MSNKSEETLVGLRAAFLIHIKPDGRVPLAKSIADGITEAIKRSLVDHADIIDLGEADAADIDVQIQVFMLANKDYDKPPPPSGESIDEIFADPIVADE